MSAVFSFLFDRLTDPLGLPIEAWKEWLILLVIGAVAYRIAFSVVGDMYRAGDIGTKTGGSFFHWLIRAVVFVVIWAVTYGVIVVAKFVAVHWIIAVSVIGGLVLLGVIIAIAIHFKRKGGVTNA